MAKTSKGSSFEREIAKMLSLWWTRDLPEPRDDIFWRTANSGGRATVRGRKGKGTANSYGDLLAVDPLGQPFIQAFTVELKRGYNRSSLADLLDRKVKGALTQYEKWLVKLIQTAATAGSRSWMLLARRDQRQTCVYLPASAWEFLENGSAINLTSPFFSAEVYFPLGGSHQLCALPLTEFLQRIRPEDVKRLAKEQRTFWR